MHCYWDRTTRRGEQVWGKWICNGIEDAIVKYCRKAFGKKYKNMWIDPLYFDDKYFNHTQDFFSEVLVALYPKITNLSAELKRLGYTQPKTKEEWDRYSTVVWEIVHKDIDEDISKGIKPVYVLVKGVRYSDSSGNFHGRIKSVTEVDESYVEE